MRHLSDILLLSALLGALLGGTWPWCVGALTVGLVLRPGMPWLGIVLGALFAGR